MLLTILNRTTGEFAYYEWQEWQPVSKGPYGNIMGYKKAEPRVDYAYLRDYLAYDLHPLCIRQMFYQDESMPGNKEVCLVVRAETEFGTIYERPRDEIDNYEWQRFRGLGFPSCFVRPGD